MKILISAIHYPVAAGRFLAEGFRRLGHEVVTIGPSMGGSLPWAPEEDFSAYAWEGDIQTPLARVLEINEQSQWYYREHDLLPDLVVQCDANFFLKGKFACPNVCWAVDNHVGAYEAVPFDLFFGAHSWGYHSDEENFVWLPCAYDPQAHYPIEGAPKQFDAAMVGVIYPHRAQMLNALAPYGSILVGQGILGEKYNQAYNSARIAIVQSACGDVPMRLFENAAQGCLIFCDRQRDLGKLGLLEGMHFICFDRETLPREDYLQQAQILFHYYVEQKELAAEIANAGREALARHTYEARAQTIIDTCKQRGLL